MEIIYRLAIVMQRRFCSAYRKEVKRNLLIKIPFNEQGSLIHFLLQKFPIAILIESIKAYLWLILMHVWNAQQKTLSN